MKHYFVGLFPHYSEPLIREMGAMTMEEAFSPYFILERTGVKLVIREQSLTWRHTIGINICMLALALVFRTQWFTLAALISFIIFSSLVFLTKRVIHTIIAEPGKLLIKRRKLFGGFNETSYAVPELKSVQPNPFRAPAAMPSYFAAVDIILFDNTQKTILSIAGLGKEQAQKKSQDMAEAFSTAIGIKAV